MNAVQKTVGGSPRRYAAVLLAIVLVMVAVPTLALARSDGAQSAVRNCGAVQHNVAVTTQGGVACKPAKKIANTWLKGKKQTSGFACHRKRTNAGSGFQGICVKGKKRVTIIPE
jgi:hypothetical protein